MKAGVILVSAALALAGCQQSSGYGTTPTSRSNTNLGDSCGQLGWGTVLGAAAGGAAGGLIGSQIGRGSGNALATTAGVIGGLLLGGFAGGAVDKVNCAEAQRAQQRALAPTTPIGQTVQWNDPKSGASGSFTPTRDGRAQNGALCREYHQTIIVGGEQKEGVGQACQQPDGSWKTVS
ncbi:MAG: RT0821/Lpp0805 family surface protein [Pseudomonadota bacterium]